jgi:hypothetical protein
MEKLCEGPMFPGGMMGHYYYYYYYYYYYMKTMYCTFMLTSHWTFLEMTNIWEKICSEIQNIALIKIVPFIR